MLLLLEPKNKSFVPQPIRFDLQSSEDSRRFAGAMSKKKLKRQAVGVGIGAAGQRSLAQSEGGVGNAEEGEERGADRQARRGDQPAGSPGVERELGDGSRDVPLRRLAADEVVRQMMVERVGLEQPSVTCAQPFPPVEFVVA